MQFFPEQYLNPVEHRTFVSSLKNIISPEQKTKYLKSKGEIEQVMRGWYLVNPTIENYSPMYAANRFYGPSYISMLTALSYFGWIVDRTYTYESITIHRGKTISNKIGRFVYHKQDKATYYLGVTTQKISSTLTIQIATPTKALYDYLLYEPNLTFSGKNNLLDFLDNDLRFATENLGSLDVELLKQLAKSGGKKRQIEILIKLIETI
jgi:predicted transcriptional regulator of viral defense system